MQTVKPLQHVDTNAWDNTALPMAKSSAFLREEKGVRRAQCVKSIKESTTYDLLIVTSKTQ